MDTLFTALAAKAEEGIPVEENDYQKDGLLYCGSCHTPKQTVVRIGGQTFMPRCLCRCGKEKRDAEVEEAKRIRREKYISGLREMAFGENRMSKWTFDADDNSNKRVTEAMRRYTDHFPEFKETGKGLLLYGPVGTGKTFAACEVANALIDQGIPCLVTNFARLSNIIQGMYDDRQNYIDGLSRYQLLVIDDLGAERKSDYMLEVVFSIIDARYSSGLPMIITTNLTIEQIKSPENVNYSRIYDRIIERCFPIEVTGKSRRRAAVRAEYGSTKSLLGL